MALLTLYCALLRMSVSSLGKESTTVTKSRQTSPTHKTGRSGRDIWNMLSLWSSGRIHHCRHLEDLITDPPGRSAGCRDLQQSPVTCVPVDC